MLSLILLVVLIVLMLAWIGGAGYASYSGPTPNHIYFVSYGIVPWICVFIVALFATGALRVPNDTWSNGPAVQQERR